MKKRNANLVKINAKSKSELDKELKLIEDKRMSLYKKYTQEKTTLFEILKNKDFGKENLLTIINDIETTFMNDLSSNNDKLIKDINSQLAFDKIDLLLLMNINQQQAYMINNLKMLIFSDWSKESTRALIAKLIISSCSLVDAAQSAGYINKNNKYSWVKYIGGLYGIKYLKQRVIELAQNPNFKFTHFNEFKDNKQVKPDKLYSEKELLKKYTIKEQMSNNSNI